MNPYLCVGKFVCVLTKEVVVMLVVCNGLVHVGRFLKLRFWFLVAAGGPHLVDTMGGVFAISILFSNGASLWVAVATMVVTGLDSGFF